MTSSREEVLASARGACAGGGQPTMDEVATGAGVTVRTLYRLFGSREALLREAGCTPPPDTRQRILEAALELVGRHGLAELSMDELAAAAGVSRATLYRLFPGKSALFSALVRTFSPWEAIADVIEAMPDGRPDEVMPAVGRAMAGAMDGRVSLLLRIVQELVRGDADTIEGASRGIARGLPDLVRYLQAQTAAGRLRPMSPLVACQLLAGPIIAHLLTEPLAASLMEVSTPRHEVIDEFVSAWLRAMSNEADPDA